jgi:hypothetical protein
MPVVCSLYRSWIIMPRHTKPMSDKEHIEMIKRFQKEDPTWNYLGQEVKERINKLELEQIQIRKARDEVWENEHGKEREMRYIQSGNRRRDTQRLIREYCARLNKGRKDDGIT